MPSIVSKSEDFGEQPHAPLLTSRSLTSTPDESFGETPKKRRCGWGWWLLLGVLGVVAVCVPIASVVVSHNERGGQEPNGDKPNEVELFKFVMGMSTSSSPSFRCGANAPSYNVL